MKKVKIKDVWRKFPCSWVAHQGGSGFSEDDPSHNLEIIDDILYEDFYVHAKGYSKRRKLGKVKDFKIFKHLHDDVYVAEAVYEENLGDWETY